MQEQTQSWVIHETKCADFGDIRLNKRFADMLDKLSTSPNESIPATFTSWGETLAAYRFFDNGQVNVDNILSAHKEATIDRVKVEKVALIIQDTSEIDYTHRDEIEGMGPLAFESQQGFYLHPSLVVTPSLNHYNLCKDSAVKERNFPKIDTPLVGPDTARLDDVFLRLARNTWFASITNSSLCDRKIHCSTEQSFDTSFL